MNIRLSLERAWYRPMSWALLLLPLSWLFRAVSSGRRFYYQRINPPRPLPVPVIVVGNISVGGTGKTPLLAALVVIFQAQGYRPGIISRGYGGSATHYPQRVADTSTAETVGDEPLLLSSLCPVVVDPDRYRAARYLLENTGCNLIFSDDGLQHYRLPRDVEIVVMDGGRGTGNGHCLPAGPLREPLSRLQTADFVVVNETVASLGIPHQGTFKLSPVHFRQLATGTSMAVSSWSLGRRVHAVAGIGNPARFAHTLTSLGFEPILHPLPDHHRFTGEELCFDDGLPVIITAKDAVKCAADSSDNVWVLDVQAEPDPPFIERLMRDVRSLAEAANTTS
ncbi:tetraacyldisaccharide 4'-kinase [Porticoccus sp.]|uniref:tetraacyldisaccharide 4'-kinase n=1 Tax=Porticoccus sp. TaxID=2024853 RepID=UPI000C4C1275|nr:tetraacyldisaccharide 4'-kinase [Porticoccus sp.]MAZ69777.1 tetraacyldisaccharide 4'-kinase [Porticoccus sp.]